MNHVVVALALLVLSGSLAPDAARSQGEAPRVRLSFQEFSEDPNRVASLVRGFTEMRRRSQAEPASADYRRSLDYWGAMHGHFGPPPAQWTVAAFVDAMVAETGLPRGLIEGLFSGVTDLSAPASPPGLGAAVWGRCAHGDGFFFAWHRLYLYWFERVLREASGDADLTLPYWDYTDPLRTAPPNAFVAPSLANGQMNPLYAEHRTLGFPFQAIDPELTDVDSALGLSDFHQFQDAIENGTHGAVHCALGHGCVGPDMGVVEHAAFDPIFWIHHTNIDRLWECWLRRVGRGAVPDDPDFRGRTYRFIDESGNEVTASVADLFAPDSLYDVSYDRVDDCSRAPLPPLEESSVFALASKPATAAEILNVTLSGAETRAPLPTTDALRTRTSLLARRSGMERIARATVVLEDIQAPATPGAVVKVYLARRGSDRRSLIGSISFFGHQGSHHHPEPRSRTFDASKALLELGPDDLELLFVATPGMVAAQPDARIPEGRLLNEVRVAKVRMVMLETLPGLSLEFLPLPEAP